MLTLSSSGDRLETGSDFALRFLGVCTVVGFAVPNAMLALHISADGWVPADYFGAWVASLPSAQLLADLAIVSVAFIGWAAIDGRRLGLRWWVTIPATLLVGICFAVPLYLLLREREVKALEPARRAMEAQHA